MNRTVALSWSFVGALLLGLIVGSQEQKFQLARWSGVVASQSLSAQLSRFVSGRHVRLFPDPALDVRCNKLIYSLGVRPSKVDYAYILGRLDGTVPVNPPDRQPTEADSALLAAPEPCGFSPLPDKSFRPEWGRIGRAFALGFAIGLAILIPLALLVSYKSSGWQRIAAIVGVVVSGVLALVYDDRSSLPDFVLLLIAAFSAGSGAVLLAREAMSWVRRGFEQQQ